MNNIVIKYETRYYHEAFDAANMDEARCLILNPYDGLSTEERWKRETPYIIDLFLEHTKAQPNDRILDFGCGIGRLSKELLIRRNYNITGIDISSNMRVLAQKYVGSAKFTVVAPETLDILIDNTDIQFDSIIAVWVLQHCYNLKDELQKLKKLLSPTGSFFVVNGNIRDIPTEHYGWIDDKLDVKYEIQEFFDPVIEGRLSPAFVSPKQSENSWWAVFKQKS